MNLFFDPNLNSNSSEVFINQNEIKHIEKVLRKKKGDFLNTEVDMLARYVFKALKK